MGCGPALDRQYRLIPTAGRVQWRNRDGGGGGGYNSAGCTADAQDAHMDRNSRVSLQVASVDGTEAGRSTRGGDAGTGGGEGRCVVFSPHTGRERRGGGRPTYMSSDRALFSRNRAACDQDRINQEHMKHQRTSKQIYPDNRLLSKHHMLSRVGISAGKK